MKGCTGCASRLIGWAAVLVVVVIAIAYFVGSDEDSATGIDSLESPAPYEVIEARSFEAPNGRTRAELRIRIDPTESHDARVLGIANTVREARETYPDATVFIVFSYSAYDVDGPAADRGFGSVDGEGLGGNRDGLVADDRDGEIQVEVDSEVTYLNW